ncbi:S-layer homology domain-containing protein [Intestinimonas massiliensis]|uniref:S-layer homology domain-containing protein n=1 Tax=Intestinimonas massiliensis (ex Afouda et al. 2020) TaxID=1673721 RepID=A0ABS9MC44_9FIRM|nr:S-layer homology domain-containing protein [Intestinimonas massiliensis (ex Afouda et al. 2020)]MCG4528362.1 S-layer homology domain-containing protein [Intestinimonas massiliensis (ex Afouda et al. 2020)]MCQ4807874.1 S-layer homology domain-containing protein [Intestinimonas massiliensis (ex Afouda et al. 2020)]
MKKRIGSLLLILALCFTLLPTAAFAAENTQEPTEPQEPQETQDAKTWGDKADTSWYVGHEADTEYHIITAEQLAGLAKLVNADPGTTNFAGKTFYLEKDLDLSGHEWISIGTVLGGDYPEYSFCGVFDGQGHVISNLYSHESDIKGADETHNLLRNALFGSVHNGEVKNLGVADAEIWIDPKDDSAAGKGILVDWMGKSKITNCWTSGSIYSGTKTEKNIGGIVGITMQGCTISGCYSTATLTGNFTNSEGYYKNPNQAKWPCDSIGGIVGARFDGSLTVTDCWFDGKIVVNSIQAAVGGIVGCIATVNNSVGGSVGDADIATKNCMVTTTDMGVDKAGNTCWVAYAPDKTVKNCYWPNDETYNPSLLADVGGVSNEEQGTAVSDFTSADVLTGLNTNPAEGIEWVAGIKHPTFKWDKWHISADYSAVDAAIADAKAIDSNLYSNYADVETAIGKVDRSKSKAEQAKVDAMAKAIKDAIDALQYKDADYTKVDAAIAEANALNKNNYKDFSGVEAAVKAVVRGKNITEQSEVDKMAKAIEDAINALVRRSSGGGSSSPSYSVTTPGKTENGTVTVSPRSAEKGDTVTITVKPDSGYQLDDLTVTDKNGKELKLTDKGNGKYTFTMPASKVEINATFVKEVETSPFSDVSTSAYYYEAVKWAQEKGITGGIGNGLFGPNQPCTRAQIVTFLWRAAGSPEPKAMSSFADVSTDAYYAKAVAWAVENGITTGTGDGKFSPDATCTRAQSVTFLFRAIGKLVDSKAEFSDVLTDSYYANAVAWAVENGVTNGIGNGLFGPDNSCTRAQIVTFLFRAYQGK